MPISAAGSRACSPPTAPPRRTRPGGTCPTDGRCACVADPNPQGGLTYLFDDVSDQLNAESRYNALRRLQAETLDTLDEPVAVFGADGRLTLANRAFCTVWRLDPATVEERPHVDAVIEACRALAPADEPWLDIRDAVVGLESRTARVLPPGGGRRHRARLRRPAAARRARRCSP